MREREDPGRRCTLMLLASVLLAIGLAACGGTSGVADSASRATRAGSSSTSASAQSGTPTAAPSGYLKSDGDTDSDDQDPSARGAGRQTFDELPLLESYGPPASAAEARTIAALVKRYYAVSLAGDAAQACSMLSASLAAGLAAHNSEDTRTGCVAPLSLLLEQQHQRLVSEGIATMLVTDVRVKGDLSLAVLAFEKTPESQLTLVREDGAWRIDELFSSYMP
jgi:hypothetical protein